MGAINDFLYSDPIKETGKWVDWASKKLPNPVRQAAIANSPNTPAYTDNPEAVNLVRKNKSDLPPGAKSAVPEQSAIQQPASQPAQQSAIQQPASQPAQQPSGVYQPQIPAYRPQTQQPTQYNMPEYGRFAQPGDAYHTRVRDVSAPNTYEVDKLISNAVRQHGSAQTMNGKRAAEGLLEKLLAYRQQVLNSANPQYDLAKQQLANQGHEQSQMLANQGAVQTGMIGAIGGERAQVMKNQGEENTQALKNKGYFDVQAMKEAGDIEQAKGAQSTALEVARIAHEPTGYEQLEKDVFNGTATPERREIYNIVSIARSKGLDMDAIGKNALAYWESFKASHPDYIDSPEKDSAGFNMVLKNMTNDAVSRMQIPAMAEGGMVEDPMKPPGQPAIPMAQQLSQPPQQAQPVNMASGGAINVAGRKLSGPGTETSDSIPAVIDGKKKAALSTGEYVIPAHIVKLLGTKFFDNLIKKNTTEKPEEEDSDEEEDVEEHAEGGAINNKAWFNPTKPYFGNSVNNIWGSRLTSLPATPNKQASAQFNTQDYAYAAPADKPTANPEQVPGFNKAIPGAVMSGALPGANRYTSPTNPYLHYEDTGNTGSFSDLYKQHQAIAPDRTDYVSPNSGFTKGPIRPKSN